MKITDICNPEINSERFDNKIIFADDQRKCHTAFKMRCHDAHAVIKWGVLRVHFYLFRGLCLF